MVHVWQLDSWRWCWRMGLSLACLASIGVLSEVFSPKSATGAEEIQIVVEGPLAISISVDALENFAETGDATGDLAFVIRFLDDATQAQFRQGLTQPIPLDVRSVDRFAYSPLGQDAIFNVGKVIRVDPEVNGFYGLRAALITAAANADSNGWSLLDAIREFPSDTIDINLDDLLELRRALSVYFDYNQAVVDAIRQQADDELGAQNALNETELKDLSQPGPYAVGQDEIVVENPALRQTAAGLTVNYDFPVNVYFPEDIDTPAPIVIISHGFGDVKESFVFIAEHLASYGFIAILPDHIGSDLSYRQTFLNGRLNTLLSPMEFLNRPQEISFLIDELEQLISQSPLWASRLDLSRIGVMGDSLGGSTVLSLAGAEINPARLADACDVDNIILNFALYLQCRARFLPPVNYQFRDERVRAVLAMHPMGGYLYGPEGMSQVDIPMLMIAGSADIVAPVVTEQIYPFIWAQSSPKYLALLQVGTHFTSKPGRDGADGIFALLAGEHRDVGTRYGKSLAIAFLQAHLNDNADYLPYLTADYGRTISEDQPLQLHLIQSLTADQLSTAYGRRLPIPINPPAIAPLPPLRDESILAEIEQTGVLRIAFRKDAPPFGYINRESEWDGYCGDMAIALSNYLEETLDMPVAVELVELTSTLQTRFDWVRDGTVHLECGPNTIRTDVEGITFSRPMLVASSRFLVLRDQIDNVNPNLPLAGVRLGILPDTTNEAFVRATYPRATVIPFPGPEGRQNAIQEVTSGQIDAFVDDDILAAAELRQNESTTDNLTLIPDIPLTCEFYGLILPNDDPVWKTIVDRFIASEAEDAVSAEWFGTVYDFSLGVAEYCLNEAR